MRKAQVIVGTSFELNDISDFKKFLKLIIKTLPIMIDIKNVDKIKEIHEKYYFIQEQIVNLKNKSLYIGCTGDNTIMIGRITKVPPSEFGNEIEVF